MKYKVFIHFFSNKVVVKKDNEVLWAFNLIELLRKAIMDMGLCSEASKLTILLPRMKLQSKAEWCEEKGYSLSLGEKVVREKRFQEKYKVKNTPIKVGTAGWVFIEEVFE